MRVLTAEQVHAEMVKHIGLDPSAADLSFPEALACTIRRAAGLVCPASPKTLIGAVLRPLYGLVEEDGLRDRLEDMVEALVAHGDLLELEGIAGVEGSDQVSLIYPAPPSFVCRESGMVMLLGVAPDDVSPLPEELASSIEHKGHVRLLPAGVMEDLPEYLRQSGLVELSLEAWLKTPTRRTPEQYLGELGRMLDRVRASGDIPGLSILDPTRPVHYYRARWLEPKDQSGRFIGRRTQAFGADLWCYVELQHGHPQRLLDLPVGQTKERGCDQAWRLQAAIDALRGEPQRYRMRKVRDGRWIVDFFSPLPMWAQRRWDCFGEAIMSAGCLFSYAFSEQEIEQEVKFAREVLWLAELE